MMTDFRTLDAGEPLQHAVALVLAGAQRDFPVTENGRLAGVLTPENVGEFVMFKGVIAPASSHQP